MTDTETPAEPEPEAEADIPDIPAILDDPEVLHAEIAGTNPESEDLPPAIAEHTADDKALAAMVVALRKSDPGIFMQLAADLRTPEAAVKAAKALQEAFDRNGLNIVAQPNKP